MEVVFVILIFINQIQMVIKQRLQCQKKIDLFIWLVAMGRISSLNTMWRTTTCDLDPDIEIAGSYAREK